MPCVSVIGSQFSGCVNISLELLDGRLDDRAVYGAHRQAVLIVGVSHLRLKYIAGRLVGA